MIWIVTLAFIGMALAVPSDICDQTFEVLAGQTRTIDYFFDGGYKGNSDCVFHLRVTGAERLRISFTKFDVEKHAQCNFDYLQVFDGVSIASHPLKKLCGYELPQALETQGNVATLKFVSDRTLNKQGFVLQFSTISSEEFSGLCQPAFTGASGRIISPHYPNNYPNKVNCTYEIAPQSGNQILIQFTTFQLERSSYCTMDYLTISSRTGQIGPKLCGDLTENSYLVSGSHAIIRFVTDRSSTRKGFELNYRVIGTCKELDDLCENGCKAGDDGMLECLCKKGYSAPKGEVQCYDINECEEKNAGCADICRNNEGSFECACGRDGFFLAPDGFNCTDRSCAKDNAGCEQNCFPTGTGGYTCTCNKGFTIDDNGHNCTDINECFDKKYQHGCAQSCINEAGSYYCDCEAGYSLSPNQRTCNDIDECGTQGFNCEHGCRNYPGGWSCSCYPGYQVNPSDPNGCVDIDECLPEAITEHCDECVNFEGGYSCRVCSSGFNLNGNDTKCLDINECDESNGGCQQSCVNTPGSFSCQCYLGQELVEDSDKGECADINECAPNDGRGPCEHYCENSVGAFECHCLTGYSLIAGSGITCQDIDECGSENGGCTQQCVNNEGSFACSCFDGYWMTDGKCDDVDECVEDKPCDKELGAKCINNQGSFQCICPSGYNVVNTTICEDVDECANSTYGPVHGCEQRCVNTPGSFHCACHIGYVDVGNNTCADVNECSQDLCEYKEGCTNTLGSFTCICKPGYFLLGDGLHCSDVDECADDTVIRCDQICINRIGHYECGCREGYELGPHNYTCVDVNECTRNISGCSDGCVNDRGSFECYCHQGFQFVNGSNTTCEDTNECAIDNGGCHHVCENTAGSRRCGCRDNYELGIDNTCHDINECDTGNGQCDQTCTNFDGGYNCSCDANFKLGSDSLSCGHCPSCEMFEEIQAQVQSMKGIVAKVDGLVQENMRFSFKVSVMDQLLYEAVNTPFRTRHREKVLQRLSKRLRKWSARYHYDDY